MQTSKLKNILISTLVCLITTAAGSQIAPRNIDGDTKQVCNLNPLTG